MYALVVAVTVIISYADAMNELFSEKTFDLRARQQDLEHQLDATLAQLEPQIADFETQLAQARAAGDDELYAQITAHAVGTLDEQWPFYNDMFYVFGKWRVGYPEWDEQHEAYRMKSQISDAAAPAVSRGFDVKEYGGMDRIGYIFYVGNEQCPAQGDLVLPQFENYAFTPIDQVTLRQETILQPSEVSDLTRALQTSLEVQDASLRLYKQQPHYRDLPEAKRLDTIQRVASRTDEILHTNVLDFTYSVRTPHFYQYKPDAVAEIEQRNGQGADGLVHIRGRVLGATALELLRHAGNTIPKSPEAATDCILLAIDAASGVIAGMKIDSDVVYIPFSVVTKGPLGVTARRYGKLALA